MAPARSIRSSLTIWLLGPLLVLSGILLLDAFVDAQRRTTSAYDRLLAAVAISISQNIRVDEGDLRVNLPFSTLAYSESLSSDHLYYEVISDSDKSDGYPGLPMPTRIPNLGTSIYYDAEYRGKKVRAAFLRGQAPRIEGVSGYSVIVAETLGCGWTAFSNQLICCSAACARWPGCGWTAFSNQLISSGKTADASSSCGWTAFSNQLILRTQGTGDHVRCGWTAFSNQLI